MIYFGYIIIFLLFLTAAGVFIFYSYRRIVYDHFQKICTRALLTAQNRLNSPRWFSSRFLNDIIRFLFKSAPQKPEGLFFFSAAAKYRPRKNILPTAAVFLTPPFSAPSCFRKRAAKFWKNCCGKRRTARRYRPNWQNCISRSDKFQKQGLSSKELTTQKPTRTAAG